MFGASSMLCSSTFTFTTLSSDEPAAASNCPRLVRIRRVARRRAGHALAGLRIDRREAGHEEKIPGANCQRRGWTGAARRSRPGFHRAPGVCELPHPPALVTHDMVPIRRRRPIDRPLMHQGDSPLWRAR